MRAYVDRILEYTRRRGTVLVLMALLMVCLLGFTALAVDLGMIATAQAQLKTVTDAAALAGARQLASERRLSSTITDLTPEITSATAQAIATGNANSVLALAAALTSANIAVGYINTSPANPSTPIDTSGSGLNFNSVQITASTTVPAFCASIFRSTGSTITVSSTASIGLYQEGYTANILPIAMDLAAFNRLKNKTGGDTYTFTAANYNPPNSTGVTTAPDGVVESVAYPVANGLAGNWGTINFGVKNNSTSTLSDQISNGITPAEMTAEGFTNNTMTLPHVFSANPGISAGIKSALNNIIGKEVAIPVYDSSGGNGNNAWYNVTFFAPARIVAVNMTGNDKYVIVQPAVDYASIPNTSLPVPWTQGGVIFLRLTR